MSERRMIKGNVERIVTSEENFCKLKAEGFETIGSAPEDSAIVSEKEPEEMTVAELKKLAKEKGLEGCSSLSKEELLSVLKGAV